MTKSYAMALDLKDDPKLIEEYVEYHRAVWPEALDSLRSLGVEKAKIFLLGRRLFMYVEVPDDFDFPADLARYTEVPRAREWDEFMRGFQEKVPGAQPDEWWAQMEQVWDLHHWPPED
jgi:L-rhamnose mutarotase